MGLDCEAYRQAQDAGRHKPFLRKHQTATTQRPMATPAVLPVAKISSLLASKMQIRKRETPGESLAPILPIRQAARMKTPVRRISQSACAVFHGSIAKGATKTNVVGRFTRASPPGDAGRTPRDGRGLGPVNTLQLADLVWVVVFEQASRAVVYGLKIQCPARRGPPNGEPPQNGNPAA